MRDNRVVKSMRTLRREVATELVFLGGGDGTRTHEPLDCQLLTPRPWGSSWTYQNADEQGICHAGVNIAV